MHLQLERTKSDSESTLGKMSIGDRDSCLTLEDQYRAGAKVKGETRIPAGTYKLRLKKIGESSKDTQYITWFHDMHKGMIQLEDVPGFEGILIHVGNYEHNTEGCILVGRTEGKDGQGHYAVFDSKNTYRRIYPIISGALLAGEACDITIVDKDH